jgi:peptide/nickel transport system ATP-binding protein
MTQALLQADGVVKHYRVRKPGDLFGRRALLKAVDGVSLAIPRGRTLGIVGESGCGKSTLGRLLLGMEAPTDGTVRFEGAPLPSTDTDAWRSSRRRMQMIFQDSLGALDRRLPVGAQIAEPLDIHRIDAPDQRVRRVSAMLDAVGLSKHLALRFPHELSGGQRQRAVIARALVLEPDLLVCDEPISALDVSIQAQIVNLLQALQRRLSITFVFISHDLKIVHYISDEIAVMYLGRIVERGPRDRIFAQPAHPYTKALIAAVPVADPSRLRSRVLVHGDPPSPFDLPQGCRFHTRCPMAIAKCRQIEPDLADIGEGHHVACHLAMPASATGKAA